jgi:energy-coupling factor transporter ATP-binding protein EcfA2
MTQPGKIVILNGASSSGKTTLLKLLQERLEQPYLNAGIDKFIWMLPERWLVFWPPAPYPGLLRFCVSGRFCRTFKHRKYRNQRIETENTEKYSPHASVADFLGG